MDDTAGFMAAVRALNQSRNVSAISGTTAVEQTPNLTDVVSDDAEPEQPTKLPVASPARDFFTSSQLKVKRESTEGFAAFDTEDPVRSIQPSSEPPTFEDPPGISFEKVNVDDTVTVVSPSIEEPPTTSSSEKPANVDDTAAFMTAARRLRRAPAGDIAEPKGTAQNTVEPQSSWLNSLSPLKEDLGSLDIFNAPRQLVAPVQNLKRAEIGRLSMSPAEHFVSAACSPAVKINDDLGDAASLHTVTVPKQEPVINGFPAASNGIDHAESLSMTDHVNDSEPEAPKEKVAISVNDTAGFLAAVRALKERNRSPSNSYTNAAPHERKASSRSILDV